MNRIYRKYTEWEEIRHNMWGSVDDKELFLGKAIKFTGDHKLYGSFMRRVIKEWPVSCENALTDLTTNRKAWIGHAATALALKCPEDITRKAWGYLTSEQRFLANKAAGRAIREWEVGFSKSTELHKNLGGPLLF